MIKVLFIIQSPKCHLQLTWEIEVVLKTLQIVNYIVYILTQQTWLYYSVVSLIWTKSEQSELFVQIKLTTL